MDFYLLNNIYILIILIHLIIISNHLSYCLEGRYTFQNQPFNLLCTLKNLNLKKINNNLSINRNAKQYCFIQSNNFKFDNKLYRNYNKYNVFYNRSSVTSTDTDDIDNNNVLYMTRKVRYGYRYDAEKVKKKGTTRSKIYFDMWKDKNPYYIIHKFLYENDPDNPNFKYDIDLARKQKCKRNIFAHYKKDNKLRFFWYASRKNHCKGPYSRYINYALDRNEFRFSKLHSYFHILPYVHKHYKDDLRYIYYMNRFLLRHGRKAEFNRLNNSVNSEAPNENSKYSENSTSTNTMDSTIDPNVGNSTGNSSGSISTSSNDPNSDLTSTDNSTSTPKVYRRTISWKEIKEKCKRDEEELYKKISTEPIKVYLDEKRYFIVKKDGFKVFGEYYSKINKKNRKTPYDIYEPFVRTKHSSKRRRYRSKIPLNPEDRCKTRRERILKNAKDRNVKDYIKKFLKQKAPATA